EGEAAAAKAASINFIHLPLNAASPDPAVVDTFLKEVTAPANQPAFVHCASAKRAAAMWMIKRIQVDKWDADRAAAEAAALGLTSSALKTFALDYVQAHTRWRLVPPMTVSLAAIIFAAGALAGGLGIV